MTESDLDEVLGSERLTGATLDRLTHRCKIIETDDYTPLKSEVPVKVTSSM